MHGVTLFDSHARHIWVSRAILPHSVWYGKSAWYFTVEAHQAIVREAFTKATFDGSIVQYSISAGAKHDLRRWDCALARIEQVQYVCAWQEKPLHEVRLTTREMQTLHAICRDEPPKQTAARLGVSVSTVETYRLHLRRKTGAVGTAGLVRWAIRNGIIEA